MTARRVRDEPRAVDTMSYHLPAALAGDVTATLEKWQASEGVRRLWARDASLWTGQDESSWLDWLNIIDGERNALHEVTLFAESVRHDFEHVVVLGMGGSSLCPDVLARTFGPVQDWPELHVLDSTDPAQIRTLQASIDIAKSLFIVSSKSGTTLEPNLLSDYFFEQVSQVLGNSQAAKHFIAVTDPGSPLQVLAERQNFAHVFFGIHGIGGRYSALSNFGMVPAAMMGLDVRNFLDRAAEMVRACGASVSSTENSGALLGTILAASARSGRDKVTLVLSPGIAALGAWLEQLLAESTGKEGRGIIPIDGESLGAPEVYGRDRLFAYLRLDSAPDPQQDAALRALENAGHPVVRIGLGEARDLGQEFFRWEVATAVAGAILDINPFNQPDVEASKIAARNLTDAYEKSGVLPSASPFFTEGPIALFAEQSDRVALETAVGADKTLHGYLRAHLKRLAPGDYFALLAYLERNAKHDRQLQTIRCKIRDSHGVATCIGFGPRFLHSTGQAYKGGPNSGVFLQLTCDHVEDLPVPGHRFTFGVVMAAQARGDFRVLTQRGRLALHVHLGADVGRGLDLLTEAIEPVLA